MGKCTEPGVLLQSDRYFNTPSAAAGKLFYYITRSITSVPAVCTSKTPAYAAPSAPDKLP